MSEMNILVKRLKPGDDLLIEVNEFVQECELNAGVILALVGSLKQAKVRFAGKEDGEIFTGPFEIVSVTGTVGAGGSHIHVALSDGAGKIIGGHLQAGSLVNTTAEVVIQDFSHEWTFDRLPCSLSGYNELIAEKAD